MNLKLDPKIRNGLSQIAQWAIALAFLLGLILIYGVAKAEGFNAHILSIGIVLITFSLIMVWLYIMVSNREERKKEKEIYRLKQEGIKVEVDLSRCRIVKRKFLSDKGSVVSENKSEIKVVYEKNNKPPYHLIYSSEINQKSFRFISQPIHREISILEMFLSHQKSTNIFVEKTDPHNYYFDTEFLN